MLALLRRLPALFHPLAWGPALAAAVGCALPLLLGVFSGHPGFYWATLGAFVASLADPRQRLGMHAMLLLSAGGAFAAALGYWAGQTTLASLLAFSMFGLLLAASRRLGPEPSKFAFVVTLCLALGAGQFGRGSFDNPAAIATLFLLGALGVTLLGFGLRGVHGLRMWPQRPALTVLWRMTRRSRHLPFGRQGWLALACYVVLISLAGLAASLRLLPDSHWLTFAVILLLGPLRQTPWAMLLLRGAVMVLGAGALMFFGYSLVGTPLMVLIAVGIVALLRLLQARPPALFVLQSCVGLLLLSESLSAAWNEPQWRLVNAAIGAALAVMMISLALVADRQLARRRGHVDQGAEAHRQA